MAGETFMVNSEVEVIPIIDGVLGTVIVTESKLHKK